MSGPAAPRYVCHRCTGDWAGDGSDTAAHRAACPGYDTFCRMCEKSDDTYGFKATHGLKHGPGGRGGPGPCDADCVKCERERLAIANGPDLVLQQVRIIGAPDVGSPNITGAACSIARRGVGRYRLTLPVRPVMVQLDTKARRLLHVFTEATFHDGMILEVWTFDNERTDLVEGEEILLTYGRRQWVTPIPYEQRPPQPVDPGPCDADCRKCAVENAVKAQQEAALRHLRQPSLTPDYESQCRSFDAKYPARPFGVGDYVRWWPHVTALGTPAHDAQWLEGEVTGIYDDRPSIRVARRSGPDAPWHDGAEGSCWRGTLVRRAERPPQPWLKLTRAEPVDPADPLDVEYDGETLRVLLSVHESRLQERHIVSHERAGHVSPAYQFTPAQRAAVSAHWSAELRAKVAASAERDRQPTILVDIDDL